MIPNMVYLTDTVFEVIPFDKSEERIHSYISIECLKARIHEQTTNDDDRFARGQNSALSELLEFIKEEEEK